MRHDPFLPSLRDIADLLLMPAVSIYDMYPHLKEYDHVIYVFPRGDEWHVTVEPPVITKARGTDRRFPENAAFRIETDHDDACTVARRVAATARRLGRSAIVIVDSVFSKRSGGSFARYAP